MSRTETDEGRFRFAIAGKQRMESRDETCSEITAIEIQIQFYSLTYAEVHLA